MENAKVKPKFTPGTRCLWRRERSVIASLVTFQGYEGEGDAKRIVLDPPVHSDKRIRHRDLLPLANDDPLFIVGAFAKWLSQDPAVKEDWGLLTRVPARVEGPYKIELKSIGATGQMIVAWLDGRVVARAKELCLFMTLERVGDALLKAASGPKKT